MSVSGLSQQMFENTPHTSPHAIRKQVCFKNPSLDQFAWKAFRKSTCQVCCARLSLHHLCHPHPLPALPALLPLALALALIYTCLCPASLCTKRSKHTKQKNIVLGQTAKNCVFVQCVCVLCHFDFTPKRSHNAKGWYRC